MNSVASGNGGEYAGSSQKEHTFGDGHGYLFSTAGTGTGSSCGYGGLWKNGLSYQSSWEAGGNMSGTAHGQGYANGHGYAYSEED